MKNIANLLLSIIFLCISSCNAQNSPNSKLDVLEIQDFEQGKISYNYQIINEISEITGINKKFLTTSIYFGVKNEQIIINDEVFNYNDYDKIKKMKNHKTILKIKRYSINNKEYIITYKIE